MSVPVGKIVIPVKSLYGATVTISPSWLSNGHWMVRKDRLAEPYLWESRATVEAVLRRRMDKVVEATDEFMDWVANTGRTRSWEPTQWLCDIRGVAGRGRGGIRCRIYSDAGDWLALDESYIAMLGLGERALYCSDRFMVANDAAEPTVVLASVRLDEPPRRSMLELFS